ncbi:MAG: MFS transporter, partial [Spirochaetota bacterium]
MPPIPNVRRIVGTLMVPTLTTVIMLAMFAVAVPFIRNDLSLAPDVASWLLVAYSLPHMMLMPLYGRLADGIGKRRLLLTGATLFAVGTAVLVVAGSFPMLL